MENKEGLVLGMRVLSDIYVRCFRVVKRVEHNGVIDIRFYRMEVVNCDGQF